MGKRIQRIFRDQFTLQLPALLNKHVFVIKNDATTLPGILRKHDSETITLTDLHRQPHIMPVSAIAELVVDIVATH